MKYQLILASKSPRRKELLGWLGVPFEIITSQVDENIPLEDPEDMAKKIATLKGEDIFSNLSRERYHNPIVVAADTIVTLDGKVYGKPENRADAKRILLELSGRVHKVITGVYIKKDNCKPVIFATTSQVEFLPIRDDILEHYLDTNESSDKAGAYGIQGAGLLFIESLNGSYSNVVGFPLSSFLTHLKDYLGITKEDLRSYFI